MPEMNGFETIQRIKEIYSKQKVIFCSGGYLGEIPERFREHIFLEKPILIGALIDTIKETLNDSEDGYRIAA
jgi:DNA-binding NtrC family response regulator